jgi:hypothetical protein
MAVVRLTARVVRMSTVILRWADVSADQRYRYLLGRRWGSGPALPWIMLNPSAADDAGDDPTTRRVISFSRSWGYGACVVVNLFAFRSASPVALTTTVEPVGRRNTGVVRWAIEDAAASGIDRIVVGWGVHGQRWLGADDERGRRVRRLMSSAAARWTVGGLRPVTLGITMGGAPRHPLYVPSATKPSPFADVPVTATN